MNSGPLDGALDLAAAGLVVFAFFLEELACKEASTSRHIQHLAHRFITVRSIVTQRSIGMDIMQSELHLRAPTLLHTNTAHALGSAEEASSQIETTHIDLKMLPPLAIIKYFCYTCTKAIYDKTRQIKATNMSFGSAGGSAKTCSCAT